MFGEAALRVLRADPLGLPSYLRDRLAFRRISQVQDGWSIPTSIGRLRLAAPGDWFIVYEILRGGYSHPGFVPRRGWRVVDAGANIGVFSLWSMRRMGSGHLIAIEPVPSTRSALMENLRRREFDIVVYGVAVGDTAGEREFAVSARASYFSSAEGSLDRLGGPITAVPAQVRTLDSIVAETWGNDAPIDLLKVDVEGMEVQAFRGAAQTLHRTRRVVFEYHSQANHAACTVLLSAAGLVQRFSRSTQPEEGVEFWSR